MAITCCVLMVGKHAYEAFPAATKKGRWMSLARLAEEVVESFCNACWVAMEFDSSMTSVFEMHSANQKIITRYMQYCMCSQPSSVLKVSLFFRRTL